MSYTQKFSEMRNKIIEVISADHPLAADMSCSDFLEMLVSRYPATLDRAGYSIVETGFFTDGKSTMDSFMEARGQLLEKAEIYYKQDIENLLKLLSFNADTSDAQVIKITAIKCALKAQGYRGPKLKGYAGPELKIR